MSGKPDPARDQRLIELHGKGLPDAVLAPRLGVSDWTVKSIRRRLNLPANPGSRL